MTPLTPLVPSTPALELREVRKRFDKTSIINGVSLAIQPGERVAIIGPNGAGKSTLFNLLSGRFAPDSGSIALHGKRIDGMRAYEINRLGLSRSFQVSNVFPNLSVFENLRCAVLWNLGYRYNFWRPLARLKDVKARAEQGMDMVGLSAKRDALAASLTYAEQRALEIAITVAGDAPVILLDEPTAGMSQSETVRCIELIRQATEGRTLLIVEHDMNVVFGLADRIAVLVYGELIALDTPANIRANLQVQEAYLGSMNITNDAKLDKGAPTDAPS